MLSKPQKVLAFLFGNTFTFIASSASILGFIAPIFSNKDNTIIALISFIVFLLLLLGRLYWETEHFVKENMQLISFTVQLLYNDVNSSTDAKLMKRKIVASSMPYTFEKAVPFDIKTLSYECNIFNPDVGYSYKLEWSR